MYKKKNNKIKKNEIISRVKKNNKDGPYTFNYPEWKTLPQFIKPKSNKFFSFFLIFNFIDG